MKKIILLAILGLALGFQACTSKEQKEVDKAIERELEKQSLPVQIAEGISVKDFLREKNNVVWVYEIDELVIPFETFIEELDIEKIKETAVIQAENLSSFSFFKRKGMNFINRFVSSISDETFEVTIKNEEL